MPEQTIEKIKKSILPQWKVCFVAALICGLLAHVYKLTSWLPNWDSLVFRYDAQDMLRLGRWLLCVACAPGSFYDLPWLTGVFAILFHALGAVCICKMFDVKKNVTAALIGAVVVTFPTVTSVLMYGYIADGYAIAFLLSCLAAMLLTAQKPQYVWGTVCITLAAGIYQAYITVTILLVLAHLIREAIYTNIRSRDSLLKCVKIFVSGAVAMVLYYFVLIALLNLMNTELLDYQGADAALTLAGFDFVGGLLHALYLFKNYFFDFSAGVSAFALLNCALCLATGLWYGAEALKRRVDIRKILLILVYVLLMPLGASVLVFINAQVDYHNLMNMGFCVFYILLLLQYETEKFKHKSLNHTKRWSVFVLAVLLVWNQTVIANVCYHKLQLAYEKSYGTLVRLADRIEQTDGAVNCDRVLIVGALADSVAYSVNLPPDMTGVTDGVILRHDDEVVGQSVVCSALSDYTSKTYTFVAGAEKQALFESAEVQEMGIWPEKDSVRVVGDVIVIKLGNEEVDK